MITIMTKSPTRTKVGVYKITNIVNNKVYIGSTTKPFIYRYRDHLEDLINNKHCNKYLQHSFNKHGVNNFKFEIKEICIKEECRTREKYWIEYYESFKEEKGYNILRYTTNSLGYKHSEETKQYLSEIKKGKPQHANSFKSLMLANVGRKHTEEEKQKISLAQKGRVPSEAEKAKRSLKVKGATFKNKRGIIKTDSNFNYLKYYNNLEECSLDINMSMSNIRGICNGNVSQKKNYYIMYEHYPLEWKRTDRKLSLKF